MQQGLSLSHRLTLSLTITGGASRSIFVSAEELLKQSDIQKGLKVIARRKKIEGKYRSVMDFLVCELFPGIYPSCKLFYSGKGPRLKKLMNPRDILNMDVLLCIALSLAKTIFEEERRMTWSNYRGEVHEAIQSSTFADLGLYLPLVPKRVLI